MLVADLHIHTTHSDGALTPIQVVEAARAAGLAAVAITDHDTISGVVEAVAAGRRLGVEVVPGVEISAVSAEDVEVHVLGYFFDHRAPWFAGHIQVLRNARWERAREMVSRLNAVGVGVSMDRVAQLALGGAVGRPHVARAICEIGAASSMDAAFGKYLVEGRPGYVQRHKISPSDAVKMILAAGGVASCGHVAKMRRDDLLTDLVGSGLAAIEVHHPDHGPATRRFYQKFAEKHGLIATGGSDAHGTSGTKPTDVGCVTVPYEIVEELRRAAGNNGSGRQH